jgi:hypothetical protein
MSIYKNLAKVPVIHGIFLKTNCTEILKLLISYAHIRNKLLRNAYNCVYIRSVLYIGLQEILVFHDGENADCDLLGYGDM